MRQGKNHIVVRGPGEKITTSFPASGSDVRGVRNFVTMFKRLTGIDLRKEN